MCGDLWLQYKELSNGFRIYVQNSFGGTFSSEIHLLTSLFLSLLFRLLIFLFLKPVMSVPHHVFHSLSFSSSFVSARSRLFFQLYSYQLFPVYVFFLYITFAFCSSCISDCDFPWHNTILIIFLSYLLNVSVSCTFFCSEPTIHNHIVKY